MKQKHGEKTKALSMSKTYEGLRESIKCPEIAPLLSCKHISKLVLQNNRLSDREVSILVSGLSTVEYLGLQKICKFVLKHGVNFESKLTSAPRSTV